MPAVQSDRPFEHRCIHCGEKPTNRRKRIYRDEDTDKVRYLGEYFSCRCFGLTLSLSRKGLNQTDPIDQNFVIKAA